MMVWWRPSYILMTFIYYLYKCSIYGLEASPRGCTLIVTGAQTVFSEVHLLPQCTFGLAQHWALSAAIVGSAVSLWPRPCMDTPDGILWQTMFGGRHKKRVKVGEVSKGQMSRGVCEAMIKVTLKCAA